LLLHEMDGAAAAFAAKFAHNETLELPSGLGETADVSPEGASDSRPSDKHKLTSSAELDAEYEKLTTELHLTISEFPSAWDETDGTLMVGEELRPAPPAGRRASDLLSCTKGPNGLTALELSTAALESARLLYGGGGALSPDSAALGATLSAEEAVRGSKFTWVRGEVIGTGTMGNVFKALDQKNGQIIAVKEVGLVEGEIPDMKFLRALENEIDIIKDLRHPRIVSFFGSDLIDNNLYVYLEYMPGGSVAQVIADFGALDESLIVSYTRDLVEGLEYLHTREPPVLHRDIKGANILVGLDCRVKLTDFGCSKRTEESKSKTIRGSIPWMAPEVITSSGAGRKADIWSLGCVIIEMATAKQPWGGFDNHMVAMYKIGISKETPRVPDFLSEIAQDFIRKCVRRLPDERWSATELLSHEFSKAVIDLVD